ncbi:MAG: hypothetical protein MJD61_20290, partial [Proteobacteria bacterium]|nr:hypothetical protein [Pseudomonadota bacterium]
MAVTRTKDRVADSDRLLAQSDSTAATDNASLAHRRYRRRTRAAEGSGATTPAPGYGRVAILGAMVLTPQLLGGVHGWSISTIALLWTVTLLCVWPRRLRVPLRALESIILLSLGWTLLQAMPMPCSLVDWLSPGSASRWLAAFDALGSESLSCTLSYAVGGTWVEIVKGATVACAFLAGQACAYRGRRSLVLQGAGLSASAMALVALVHGAVGAGSVFGVYQPIQAGSHILLAPLMNENHLGGFLAFGTPLLAGLGVKSSDRVLRLVWFGAAALAAATCVLTMSRGAVVSLLLVAVLSVPWGLRRLRDSLSGPGQGSFDPLSAVALLSLVLVLGSGLYAGATLSSALFEASLDKLRLVGQALLFVGESPVFGVGRGAFA